MRRQQTPQILQDVEKSDQLAYMNSLSVPTMLCNSLALALPNSECEVILAYVVQQLCKSASVTKREYDRQRKQNVQGKAKELFAVRSGGHSPIAGAASIRDGVVVDLHLFHEVTHSENGSSVVIGTGAKWTDVSKSLDEKSIAAVGGRNSAVGVGGLTLGGKPLPFTFTIANLPKFDATQTLMARQISSLLHCPVADTKANTDGLSFVSPRFGLVCSNILNYEIVLASGNVTTASASNNNQDL
ncbi:hypothetical protein N7G274_006730 [Stereocaulon virgatum]|uniref:FAD linked oxidase N-terminal domain-containing protein n=1 Tax=Stereocaulon virgatum TaxID=373712 RepID=A0ABR4A5X2_9LECA